MTCEKTAIPLIAWNVENLFHPETGGPRFDMTPTEGWTTDLYEKKIARVGETLNRLLDRLAPPATETANSLPHVPALIGLTEVENPQVVADLLHHLPPRFALALDPTFTEGYHDCIVLYDSEFFALEQCVVHSTFERYPRGDVVQATLRVKGSGAIIELFCCHLKARPGNQYYTSMYREAVCDNLQTLVWKLHEGHQLRDQLKRIKGEPPAEKPSLVLDRNVVIMGDFNDEPFSKSILEYLLASYDKSHVTTQRDPDRVTLYNLSWERMLGERPGSYYYEKSPLTRWSMLDQIVVSPALLMPHNPVTYEAGSFQVVQDLTCDERGVPFRTQTWDDDDNIVWQEGTSDHFPVTARLLVNR